VARRDVPGANLPYGRYRASLVTDRTARGFAHKELTTDPTTDPDPSAEPDADAEPTADADIHDRAISSATMMTA
jgi:hypothetical protein